MRTRVEQIWVPATELESLGWKARSDARVLFSHYRSTVYLHATTLLIPSRGHCQRNWHLLKMFPLRSTHYISKGARGRWLFPDDNLPWQKQLESSLAACVS